MTPYRISAAFKRQVSYPDLMIQPRKASGSEQAHVILVVTDSWNKNETVSSSGAKLYVMQPDSRVDLRSRALARAAALLNEEDFDVFGALQLDGTDQASSQAAPKQQNVL